MKIVGHRGARGLAPENTVAGLQKGLQHRVDELEFDLRVTKDSVVVLHHDAHLCDASGAKFLIATHTYAELKSHKPDLPTFEEALDAAGHTARLYVEVKGNVPAEPIVTIIHAYLKKGWQATHFLLGSKSQKTLLALHEALPDIQKIVIEPCSGVRATHRARQLDTKFISMNQLWLWSGYIGAVKRNGYKLYAYTLNDPKKAARWQKSGLYGVVTDYPDRFQK